jgi:hypothetical protein
MADRSWIRAIGKRLREDLGDCPTVPQELLDMVRQLTVANDNGSKKPASHLQLVPARMSKK